MPLNDDAEIEISALRWVPPPAQGMVKDLRVRWALEEAGLDYRVRLLDFERPPEYAQEQAFNQVPCFADGKVQIFESGAILQYIGEGCEALLPSDPMGKYRAIQWAYAAVSSVEPFVQFRALLNGPFANQEWAAPATPTFDHYAQMRLKQLSDSLADKPWLEGDRFTIGDLMMVMVLRIAGRSGQLANFANLQALVARGEARPAFQQALSDQLAAFRDNQPEGMAA
ncbi:MAG: glutathione S-transferase family protein [Sphingomicrobium sp.]